MNSPCLSILLLTEDSGRDSHETLRALVKKMLLLVDPACQTQPQRIELCPQPERAARAMHANIWKSRSPRDRFKLVDLRETIATKLLEEDGFVFFHFDGDRPWGERTESENVARFDEFVRAYVEPIVEDRLRRRGVLEEKPLRMERIRPLVPFYSIEAWLYQNTTEGAHLCQERGCGRHVELFAEWARDRARLDEVVRPKSEVCFKAERNRHLAEHGFPAQEVFAADRSFAATVISLLDCEDLCAAIARTAR